MPGALKAFDVDSYNKGGFNFALAKAAGYDTAYIKLGGDNLSPRYRGSGYLAQFQRMCDAGFTNRGSYWISGGYDPVGSARFYLANLDPRTTFDVLDNEPLDGARAWTDNEAAQFFDVLIAAGRTNLFQYGSRIALWNDMGPWPELQKRRIKAIVADYNGTPMRNINLRAYPADLIAGHQFADNSAIGGLSVDEDAFLADAFTPAAAPLLKEDIMHFSEPWHTIFWPNGYFSGYDPMVWNAIKYWWDNGVEQPGTEGTVVREMNTALDLVSARTATTVASTVAAVIPQVTGGGALSADDLQKITAAALAALPKSYTLTAGPAA